MNTHTKAIVGGVTILALGGLSMGVAVASATGIDVNPLNNGNLDKAEQAALNRVGAGRVTEAEVEDEGGRTAYEIEVTRKDGSEVDVDLDAGYAVLHVDEDDEGDNDDNDNDEADDRGLTDSERNRAGQVALGEVARSTVTDVSAEDDVIDGKNAAYEVELTRGDNTEFDVYLDAQFTVLSTIQDNASGEDRDHED